MPSNYSNKKPKTILVVLFSIILLSGISYLMLKGTGSPRSFIPIVMLVYMIALCSSSKKIFWFFIFPFIFLKALYSPIGFTYGGVSYDFLIAGIATDTLEAGEFLHQIPYQNYLIPFIIIGGTLLYRKLIVSFNIQFYKNKTFLCIAILTLVASQAPMHFIRALYSSTLSMLKEQQILNESIQQQTWGDSSLINSKYDNYILVIGESARRDYHHAYGYSINNTPFMSSSNGVIVNGLTSGGSSTVPSLKAMLTLSDKKTWDADYTKTLIGLAQSAEIETYWISNQGYLGTFDTPISTIAKGSDQTYFLKYGDYSSKNTSDFELLPILNQVIHNNSHKKKLIVVHLYGSHPNACDRINDYSSIHTIKDSYYDYLNCYITSIHKTDTFLQKVNNLFIQNQKKTHESFSLLYFSDHGLAHNEINNVLYFNNNKLSKLHYEVPLFMTSSNINDQKTCSSFKSGLNFTNGLANWIGIQNDLLDPNYSLFDCQDDDDDYGLSLKLKEASEDAPINLIGK